MGIAGNLPRVRYSAAYPTGAERMLRRETKTTVAIYCGNQVWPCCPEVRPKGLQGAARGAYVAAGNENYCGNLLWQSSLTLLPRDALLAAVPDYPAADIAELLEKTLHPIPNRAASNLRARLAAVKDKAQAASQLKKLLPVYDTLAEGPKRKACAARIASAYVALDDWPNANKYFAVSDSPAAAAASAELKLQDEPEASRPYDKPADAWWLVELPKKDAKLSAAIRTHAAALYAKSLPSLKGLAKVQAERRIAEVESAAESSGDSSPKSSASSSASVGTAKYYGVELVGGSVKESKGILSGFANGSYAKIKCQFEPQGKPIESVVEFETGEVIDEMGGVLGTIDKCGFAPMFVKGKQITSFLSSNGASWNLASGTPIGLSLAPKTTYRIKVTWEENVYKWFLWTKSGWQQCKTIINGPCASGGADLQFGTARAKGFPFSGSINLNHCYIRVGGQLLWEGAKGAYRNANRQ